MRYRNVWPDVRVIPALDIAVDPAGEFIVPDWAVAEGIAAGLADQVWFWEAADDEARALVKPEFWDHPYVAELEAAGQKVAARPTAAKAAKASKDGE